MDLEEQVARGIQLARERYGAEGFIAYFQTGTSTHAPADLLRERVERVLAAAPFSMVAFATRPDCLPAPILDWLAALRERYEVWVELGVQTCHDSTLLRIRRGHDVACSFAAARAVQARGLQVAAHVILGLPGEGPAEYAETARRLRQGPFAGIKIHNLQIVRGSAFEALWRRGEVEVLDEHAYGEVLMGFLRQVPAPWPVMRLVADTPADQLLAPRWWMAKSEFRQYVMAQMQQRGWRQGDSVGIVPAPPARSPECDPAQLRRTQQFRAAIVPRERRQAGSPLVSLLQAAALRLHDPERGAVVLAIGFGEGPLAIDALDVLPGRLGPQVVLHGLSGDPGALSRMRLGYPDQDGCLAALELSGHCRRAWGRVAVHWGDPRRTVVRVAGNADLVILEPDRAEEAPSLFSLDFLRRVVRLMGPGAALVSACSSPRLRGGVVPSGPDRGAGPGRRPAARRHGGGVERPECARAAAGTRTAHCPGVGLGDPLPRPRPGLDAQARAAVSRAPRRADAAARPAGPVARRAGAGRCPPGSLAGGRLRMSRAGELRGLLASLGVHPSRGLGQNFLVDGNMLEALVRHAAPSPGQVVLEVGPGTGLLTARLLAAGCQVTAIELDHRLAAYLRQRFAGESGFRLIEEDACRADYPKLFGAAPFRCIANLPYSCSTPFLAAMAELDHAPTDLHVLLQREMAERLAAAPGTPDYGAVSVRVQLRYSVRVLRTVPAQVFWPPPAVASAFARFELLPEGYPAAQRRLAGELAGVVFAQRRKQAAKLLARHLGDAARAQELLRSAGLSPEARGEVFTVADFARLAACLQGQ
jgi:16S rRNA (adenine1518-N6/adenine1519-N6)-dimethyltransferase